MYKRQDTIGSARDLLNQTGARRAILIYNFAPGNVLRSVARSVPRVTLIRGPINALELRLACQAELGLAGGGHAKERPKDVEPLEVGPIPERTFSANQLAKLASIDSQIQCECPKHLANILFGLTAFEAYSAECESRNPEDEELHASLHTATAQARLSMEQCLERVLRHEGLEI